MSEGGDSVSSDGKEFRLWTAGCAHVHTDKRWDRLSLADAITDSEESGDEGGQSFDWDIMLHLGDLKGNQDTPDDEEDTTVASGLNEGIKGGYHGNFPAGAPEGASFILHRW